MKPSFVIPSSEVIVYASPFGKMIWQYMPLTTCFYDIKYGLDDSKWTILQSALKNFRNMSTNEVLLRFAKICLVTDDQFLNDFNRFQNIKRDESNLHCHTIVMHVKKNV